MVRLEEVADEAFLEKPSITKDGALLDDDEDYTDTDSEISDSSDLATLTPDESLFDRIFALRDMIPPKARARISSTASSIYSTATTGVTLGGKGIWILTTSVLLMGIPYALALGEEQQLMEEERQRGMMAEGAQGMIQGGEEAKPAL